MSGRFAFAGTPPARSDGYRIVVNNDIGVFGLSRVAAALLAERKGFDLSFDHDDILRVLPNGRAVPLAASLDRADPVLVGVVEELGTAAWGENAELRVVTIPESATWKLHSVCGYEFVELDGPGIDRCAVFAAPGA
jgi:hypothetical protein